MISISKSDIVHHQYFELIQKIYGNTAQCQRYVNDSREGMNMLLANKISTVYFHLLDGDILIGHIGLICLSKDDAYFGFFELTDASHFQELWKALLEEAKLKELKQIFGPVNGTVWHPYRLISESGSEPYFFQEPISTEEYFNLFAKSSPSVKIDYHSAYRTNFDIILSATNSSLDTLHKDGIKIVREGFSSALLKEIYDMSVSIFSINPGYFHLSFSDFLNLYSNVDKTKAVIFKVLHQNKSIGFSYNLLDGNTLIMKTIGLLSEWQEKGIGNALVHEVHQFASNNQLQKVIYALIRIDNRVKHFPKDDTVIFRKYAAFSFNLS